ncbi:MULTISPECIES: flavin monoamine oxidase family protein [unclassified Sinorhizobium]|uniref:flavin monoamine oxidase family protein n=1 Tax=unclassified Sinorhizobium TaxID=2613772 RepID=UPI0035252DC2
MNDTISPETHAPADTADVVIVGAGAAGIAAARHLLGKRPDLNVVVLEASSRVGGRALSIRPEALAGQAIDLGCGWFHGSHGNEWLRIARDMGFTIDETPAPWNDPDRRYVVGDATAESLARQAINSFFLQLHQYDTASSDAAWSDAVPAGSRWTSRFEMIASMMNGSDMAHSSIADFQNYEPGEGPDIRTVDGYGTVVAAYSAPLNIHLETAVSTIDHNGAKCIAITTNRGVFKATAVIVTVSTMMLSRETVRFDPPLASKIEAASNLPLGKVNKLFLAGAPADLPRDKNLLGTHGRTGAVTYQIRPFGIGAIEAYIGGQLAEDLERAGEQAAAAFAIDELVAYFGSDLRQKLSFAAMSGWCGNPWIGGAYSYALPGQALQRDVLSEPVDGRLFFAGEACPPGKFSTAHGAYESGVEAAEAAMIRFSR